MSAGDAAIVVSGWTIFLHPLLLEELEALVAEVERLRKKDPKSYRQKRATKKLAMILKLITETVPSDPTRPEYRHGSTLGDDYKHWFRVKFAQQYRLFFRYSVKEKVLIFAWVNDEGSLRAYGSATDAYAVFAKMLERGNPPDDWTALKKAAETTRARTKKVMSRRAPLS
jgi:toxin YhaV